MWNDRSFWLSDKCVETRICTPPADTEVESLIWNWPSTEGLPNQTLPNWNSDLPIQVAINILSCLPSFNDIQFSIIVDSLFSTLSVFKNKCLIDIRKTVQFDRYVRTFQFHLLPSSSWVEIGGKVKNARNGSSKPPTARILFYC